MAITMEQIKDLREQTGVSITACKKALEEADGDFDKAVDVLRKKGEAKAAARSDRDAAEGVVSVKKEGSKAAIVDLRCETDFVARDEGFVQASQEIADKVFSGELEAGDTELEMVKELGLKLGENIKLDDSKIVEGDTLGVYIHSNKKIGVIVSLSGGSEELAKDIAMHIAATNPKVLSPDEISDDLVSKEKEIWADQLKNEGKPEEIIEKIMMGKEKKYREENALIKQDFVKNPEQTIEQLLEEADAKIDSFVRMGS